MTTERETLKPMRDLADHPAEWVGHGSRFGFIDDQGEPLIEYQANVLKVPASAKLVLSPQAVTLAELPLLIVLGWYVTVLTFDDMSGAAAAG